MGLNNPNVDLQRETVTLSAAQLATANTSPVVVIPVPAGKIAQVLSAAMIRTAGTISPGFLRLRYANDDSLAVLSNEFFMGGVSIKSDGSGFNNVALATVQGKNIVLKASADNTGAIATVTINNGGTDWAVNDTFSIQGGGTGQVTAQTGGVVTAVTITDGDIGHTVGETGLTTSGASGIGVDLTLNVATITPANSSGILSVVYHLITV